MSPGIFSSPQVTCMPTGSSLTENYINSLELDSCMSLQQYILLSPVFKFVYKSKWKAIIILEVVVNDSDVKQMSGLIPTYIMPQNVSRLVERNVQLKNIILKKVGAS